MTREKEHQAVTSGIQYWGVRGIVMFVVPCHAINVRTGPLIRRSPTLHTR
jgi:hypothetical protein